MAKPFRLLPLILCLMLWVFSALPAQSALTLKVTELMYNPPGGDSYEYVELQNTGAVAISLAGVKLAMAVTFTFPAGTSLAAGEYIVVVRDLTAFRSRYGNGPRVAGECSGKLNNSGEEFVVLDAQNNKVQDFTYSNGSGWPSRADGEGTSLEVKDLNGDYNNPDTWHSSEDVFGSPGRAGSHSVKNMVINEILAHTDPPQEDAIELLNTTSGAVDIGGWFLSDSLVDKTSGNLTLDKYRIPDGTIIPAGGFYVIYQNTFDTTNPRTPFSLSMAGDQVYLTSPNASGQPGVFVDEVSFAATRNGESLGRYKTSDGTDFTLLSSVTFGATNYTTVEQFRQGQGAPNSAPKLGDIIINEIMYHPPDLPGAVDDLVDEYLELYNRTSQAINLYDSTLNQPWKIGDGVEYSFKPGAYIPPNGFVLVVPFDPVSSPTQAAQFHATYPNIPKDVLIAGPWSGKLSNGGESVLVSMPIKPPVGETTADVTIDCINYKDGSTWPATADGDGPSLERVDPNAYGSDPLNWTANQPKGTPGRRNTNFAGNATRHWSFYN